LLGAALGAILVNGFKSYLTAAFPDFWLFFLGALFVLVTLFFPSGIAGLVRLRKRAPQPAAPQPPATTQTPTQVASHVS